MGNRNNKVNRIGNDQFRFSCKAYLDTALDARISEKTIEND